MRETQGRDRPGVKKPACRGAAKAEKKKSRGGWSVGAEKNHAAFRERSTTG